MTLSGNLNFAWGFKCSGFRCSIVFKGFHDIGYLCTVSHPNELVLLVISASEADVPTDTSEITRQSGSWHQSMAQGTTTGSSTTDSENKAYE